MTTQEANERLRDDLDHAIRDAEDLLRNAEDLLKATAGQSDEQVGEGKINLNERKRT